MNTEKLYPQTYDDLIVGKYYLNYANKIVLVTEIDTARAYPIRINTETNEIKDISSGFNLREQYIILNPIMYKECSLYVHTHKTRKSIMIHINATELFTIDVPLQPISIKTLFSEYVFPVVDKYIHTIKSREKTVKQGATMVSELHLIDSNVQEEFKVEGTDLQEKYVGIVSQLSKLTQNINDNIALGDSKELAEAFISARNEIRQLTNIETPGKITGFVYKLLGDNKITEKIVKNIDAARSKNDSVQENINYLFGLIHTKYESLISIGENLQKAKGQLMQQMNNLEELSAESDKEKSLFENEADIPIRNIALDTQIKASVEKYRNRLLKIDGAIMATQATIIALGKDLPALKTDLTDEMAIGGLLSSVDDYQKMYSEIATLVSNVAEATAEQTHLVIENLLELQIKDTHTMTYLSNSIKRGEKFAYMISDKTDKLAKKIQRDATFIADIAKGNTIEHARKNIKLLD